MTVAYIMFGDGGRAVAKCSKSRVCTHYKEILSFTKYRINCEKPV